MQGDSSSSPKEPRESGERVSVEERLAMARARNSLSTLGKLAQGDFEKTTPYQAPESMPDTAAISHPADEAMNNHWRATRRKAWQGDTRPFDEQVNAWAGGIVQKYFAGPEEITGYRDFFASLGYTGKTQEEISDPSQLQAEQARLHAFLSNQREGFYGRYCRKDGTAHLADSLTSRVRTLQADDPALHDEIERTRQMMTAKPVQRFLAGILADNHPTEMAAVDAFNATVELRIAQALGTFTPSVLTHPAAAPAFAESLRSGDNAPNEPALLDYLKAGQEIPVPQAAQQPETAQATSDVAQAGGAQKTGEETQLRVVDKPEPATEAITIVEPSITSTKESGVPKKPKKPSGIKPKPLQKGQQQERAQGGAKELISDTGERQPDQPGRFVTGEPQVEPGEPGRPLTPSGTAIVKPETVTETKEAVVVKEPETAQAMSDVAQSEETALEAAKYVKERVVVVDAGGRSETHREQSENQDAYFVSREHGAFGVFDGLGEGALSEKASHGVSEYLNKVLADPGLHSLSFKDTKKYVEEQIEKANEVISEITHGLVLDQMKRELEAKEGHELTDEDIDERYTDDELQEKYDEILHSKNRFGQYKVKIGTTASVVKIWEGEEAGERKKKAILANVGDSRIYRLRQDSLELLTLDDTWLRYVLDYTDAKRVQDARANAKLVRDTKAKISWWDYEDKKIMVKATTPERVEILNRRFKRKGFIPFVLGEEREMTMGKLDFSGLGQTQAMGEPEIEPRMDTIDLLPGDRLIITSDGVHDQLTLDTIARVVTEHAGAQAGADALIAQVVKEHRFVDDITAVVINIR